MRQRMIVSLVLGLIMLTGVAAPLPAMVAARQQRRPRPARASPSHRIRRCARWNRGRRRILRHHWLVRSGDPAVFHEPPGTPAEQTIIDAVATIIELAACQNAGDFLRVGALYTDDGLAEDFWWMNPTP